MRRAEPYSHVQFTWLRAHEPVELVEMLKSKFAVTPPRLEKENRADISPYIGQRWEVLVKADTLSGFLGATRAVLFQTRRAPFTQRDVELRRIVFMLYPHNRSTPFPWGFTHEPPFEIEKEGV